MYELAPRQAGLLLGAPWTVVVPGEWYPRAGMRWETYNVATATPVMHLWKLVWLLQLLLRGIGAAGVAEGTVLFCGRGHPPQSWSRS